MPWSISNQFRVEYGAIVFSLRLEKILNLIEKGGGLSLLDTSFAPRDSSRQLQKNWPFHPLPVVMGASIMPNTQPSTKYFERHSWGR